jgi:hypothetical protein
MPQCQAIKRRKSPPRALSMRCKAVASRSLRCQAGRHVLGAQQHGLFVRHDCDERSEGPSKIICHGTPPHSAAACTRSPLRISCMRASRKPQTAPAPRRTGMAGRDNNWMASISLTPPPATTKSPDWLFVRAAQRCPRGGAQGGERHRPS